MMNIEQAKEVLSGYVRGPAEQQDAQTLQALQMLRQHPELQEWMRMQETLDPQLSRIYNDIAPPAGLEAALLKQVGARSERARWKTRYSWIGAIAALLVIGAGTVFLLPHERLIQSAQEAVTGTSPDDFEQFRDGMAYYISKVYFTLDHTSQDLDSIKDWLSSHEAPVFENIPVALGDRKPIGCKELSWQGREVSLICFHTDEGGIVHLFVMERSGADADSLQDISRVARSHGLETGGWSSESKLYLLVGSDPGVDIEFVLG